MTEEKTNHWLLLAEKGLLPEDFELWSLADETGRTAAHRAAKLGNLPPGFSAWELSDKSGWTVAQTEEPGRTGRERKDLFI